jgi:polyhydroxyalkanoate synthase subunit PhaC
MIVPRAHLNEGNESAVLDRILHAAVGRMTGGTSPIGLSLAVLDWATHLAASPGRMTELMRCATLEALRGFDLTLNEMRSQNQTALPESHDRRFASPAWHKLPYSAWVRQFAAAQHFWDEAVKVHGVSQRHQALLAFLARQALDMIAPSNYVLTNPDILKRSVESQGLNLFNGWLNALDDLTAISFGHRAPQEDRLRVGVDVATTEGVVIARTSIAEIIHYKPRTEAVHSTPVVIVPAWIMKYYILDLSPSNSLIRHLVDQGFSVFVVSWKNPTAEDRNIGLDDYRIQGVNAAIDAARAITGAEQVHLTGYCLGGTLAAIAAAAMGRDGNNYLKSLSLFASQTDFHDAGELRLFISESQLALIEDMMWMRGYLQADEMAGTFHILRSNDLIWSRMISNYAMGEREKSADLMQWSDDATRMPYRMHSEYLRWLYLENRLAEGQLMIDGYPVALRDITVPIFLVGTEWDHVAPWRSVYKLHLAAESEITFVLAKGGHNAGIVSPPEQHDRHFRIGTQAHDAAYMDPETWLSTHQPKEGSWWPAWFSWLHDLAPEQITPPPLDHAALGYPSLGPAPGLYIHD